MIDWSPKGGLIINLDIGVHDELLAKSCRDTLVFLELRNFRMNVVSDRCRRQVTSLVSARHRYRTEYSTEYQYVIVLDNKITPNFDGDAGGNWYWWIKQVV